MKQFSWNILFFAWIVALVATLGSLFFGEVVGFVPCSMCWYQRICMYPLVFILLVGLLKRDKTSILYASALVLIGWSWAFYQTLLVLEIITEEMSPCSFGVPCSVAYLQDWGLSIDIPMLSLIAFTLIAISLIIIWKKEK